MVLAKSKMNMFFEPSLRSFNKRYVYRALMRIRSSCNKIKSSGGKACSYQANTSFRYQCCDMIPNRLILCFERGRSPLNMKISISTSAIVIGPSIIHSQEMFKSAANVRQH